MRPDIVLFSNALKRAILIELTCPCEENMESWHSDKLLRYSGLVNMIKHNGWYVDLFAVEVGARGYCSICLKRLGFPNKLAFSTARKLGQTSMKCSFCIWLARNSKEWSEDISVSSDHSTSTASGVEKSLTPPSAEKPSEVSFNVLPVLPPNCQKIPLKERFASNMPVFTTKEILAMPTQSCKH